MKTLISVPPTLVHNFNHWSGIPEEACFATCDPGGVKLGSGGGTTHLIHECWKCSEDNKEPFEGWLNKEKRVILHAGGQSRRLPAYGPSGKALIPVPVFKWASGQRIDQSLLDLQLPLLERILSSAPDSAKWIIASGDVLVWQEGALPPIPDADVVCVGLSESVENVTGHGVFFTPKNDATQLKYMLQKPSVEEVGERACDSLFFIDVGIWVLSHRAMKVLLQKSGWNEALQRFENGHPDEYDLYSDFGLGLGTEPTQSDKDLAELTHGVVPMNTAEFYHFGRNSDTIRSCLALQERVNDPKRILSPLIKPHPAIFVQNSQVNVELDSQMRDLWIENSVVGNAWSLSKQHFLTGIPENDWSLNLREGDCLDVVPLNEGWAIRCYGYHDTFRGALKDEDTLWNGRSFFEWLNAVGLSITDLGCEENTDIQFAPIFPVVETLEDAEPLIMWMQGQGVEQMDPAMSARIRTQYLEYRRVSADALNSCADLDQLFEQREQLLSNSFPQLFSHSDRNIFHQIDLAHAAQIFAGTDFSLPEHSPDPEIQLFSYIRDRMFRHAVMRGRGVNGDVHEREAFAALQSAIIDRFRNASNRSVPVNSAITDQVIWARSPVRLDLAGGWSDTPPYCLLNGGSVVNVAVELNGQPPIQVFLRVCSEPHILIHSIDLGLTEKIEAYSDIEGYALGSGFAIPKAALALAGFHPHFQNLERFPSLANQLQAFGGGIEISLLCAVPKGSGLGTSSILGATILGALSDLCGLGWERHEIADRTSAIEQMLTSGGGWQDQYGGILHGIKHLRTESGLSQLPDVRWLPDHLFRNPEYAGSMLLYYTGITRVAKSVLGEIVRGMFLNQRETLSHLHQIYEHAGDLRTIIERGDFQAFGKAILRSWELNQGLDMGTNPPEVQRILDPIKDWLLGMKLPGAGGGGYFLLIAKDPEAAGKIRNYLQMNPPNDRARFVDFSISSTGLKITRS